MNKKFLVAIIFLLFSALFVWEVLDADRTRQITALVDTDARALHLKVENDISSRIQTLERIAQRWILQNGTPRKQFEGDLYNIVNDLPGFQAIEWVDGLGYVRWVVPLEGNEAALDFHLASEPKRKEALDEAKLKYGPTITQPVNLVQGGSGFLVYFPLYISDRFDGFVLAVMRFDEWLKHVLSVDSKEYRVDFLVNEKLVFGSVNSNNDSYFAATFSRKIIDWNTEIRLTPTLNFIQEKHNYFPEYATAVYLTLSLLLLCGTRLIIRLTKTRTSLKLSEEKASQLVTALKEFKSLIDEVKDCVFVFDSESLVFTYVNKGAETQVGYGAEELLAMHPYDLKPEYDESSFRQMIQPLLNKSLPFINFETLHQHKEGHHINVNINLQLVKKGEHKLQFVAIVRDITELKMKEKQLRQSQKLEAIGRLAGGIAHDFNNQLNVILGCAEIIQQCKDSEKIKKFTNKISMAADVSAKLTKQLLTFARNQEVVFEVVDIHSLIKEISEISSRTFEKKISIQTELNANLCKVNADSSLIYNAILNIVINAKDAMSSGGVLKISTCNLNEEDEFIFIEISDTGKGIPQEELSLIFEPFFTTKPLGQGTGLGLSSVKGAIEQNKGTIDVESELDKGTTFKITLPLCTSETAIQSENKSPVSEIVNREKKHVMVVDDEPLVGEVFCEYLSLLGFSTVYLKSGFEAIEHLNKKNTTFELVITDMLMPEMDGLELLESIKSINESIKVIVVSGFLADNKISEIIDAGAHTVLQKPLSLEKLEAELEHI